MIVNKIDNKIEYKTYVILNFILSIICFGIGIIAIISLITSNWTFINALIPYYGFAVIFIVFGLFEFIIRPSYIETIINEREIIIRTFKPNIRNGLRFIFMLRYSKYLKELRLSHQEYNDYKLYIDKFGFRKLLILQKIHKSVIYKTSKINISFLGQKKYTNLILSIDRLRSKINLN